MKAIFIRSLEGFTGEAKLFKLEPPMEGNEFVAVSKTVAMFSGPETYIFPADEAGNVTNWGELPGSTKGDYSHEEVLSDCGYEVVSE